MRGYRYVFVAAFIFGLISCRKEELKERHKEVIFFTSSLEIEPEWYCLKQLYAEDTISIYLEDLVGVHYDLKLYIGKSDWVDIQFYCEIGNPSGNDADKELFAYITYDSTYYLHLTPMKSKMEKYKLTVWRIYWE